VRRERIIPESVHAVQTEASDPTVSAFVAANAGSGKTHVLAQRVIRLLLAGNDPARILCLTFTKAAAANMANRVFDILRQWTALDDETLRAAMRASGVPSGDHTQLVRARRLFAEAIETPGGLKVQTIHAFCTRLLHQFPFEANVPAGFAVLDDRMQEELLDRAGLSVLLDAAGAPGSELGRALRTALAGAADITLREVVNEAIGRRDDILRWIAREGDPARALSQLALQLGLTPGDSLAGIEAEIVDGPIFPSSQWLAAADICATGSSNDQKQCARLREAAAAADSERLNTYLSVFFSAEGGNRKSLLTKSIAETQRDLAARLTAEQKRLILLRERRRAAVVHERTAALIVIVLQTLERYRLEKERRGLLDYDDLIDKTLTLLRRSTPTWVHYKLDHGIDHVLIDEAQDTSPRQWDIVLSLVSEFGAGAGARNIKRTVFAVGDEKQSIFSFQGAVPHEFDRMRRQFASVFDRPELGWRYVRFHHSFRSGANVLGAVDEVFREQRIFTSVTSDTTGIPAHEPLPGALPGEVEIWETEKPDDAREVEGWDAPFDLLTTTSPQVRLAGRIARRARDMIAHGVAAGHILVLVRQRGALFEAIIRALKNAGLAVAGADRLSLTEHIAIEDLMALADALLLPHDDLALAVTLKSPLCGFDEQQLFELAWNRRGTLRAALREKHPEICDLLDRLAERARRETPFAFYSAVLNRHGGRRRIFARLGMEAADALDEFLNLALAYESREAASLQGFVAWLRSGKTEIKRDMDIARDEIRVMTVHGAKGLEAPVVILADTTTKPRGSHPPRLLALGGETDERDASPLVWARSGREDVAIMASAREQEGRAAEDEYRRLLYVAMTRAAERLIVCGYDGEKARHEGCWYDLVMGALGRRLTREETAEGPIFRYRKVAPTAPAPRAQAPAPTPLPLPAWITRDAPAQKLREIATTPSGLLEDDPHAVAPGPAGARANALARGIVVHRLLQSLPDIAPARRMEAARRYLARAGDVLDEAAREDIVTQISAILDNARFKPLFVEGSRAEVPVIGRLARGHLPPLLVSGQIDRLAVTADSVLIGDYKTNRPAPRTLAEVPPSYIRQLALYRAVLAPIYPGRGIRAALIWTDNTQLMDIPSASLDAAYSKIATLTSL
jgi:ATP-dependent helicase/nuclease subunit A